jgi:phospholipid/cholesterol/gamma-HCH transport system substrate-binding protein
LKINREIKTAILVISSLLLIVFLYNYLKGENLINGSRTFYTVYDNVEGLGTSSPVTINGFVVGKVYDISFVGDGSGKIKVRLLLDEDYEFSKNSEAQLYENGLIGGKAIAIVPAFDNADQAMKGDYLKGVVKGGLSELLNSKLTPLQEKIEKMAGSADELLNNINSIFDENTKANLKQSIAELKYTISSFKGTSDALQELIVENESKLDSTLTNVNSISGNLASITENIEKANLTATINDLQSTLNSFNELLNSIDNGEGSIGKLLKDEGLYNNLEGASKQLEQLLQDMKLNPKRYVHFSLFGRKTPVYDVKGNEIKDKQNP